MTKAWLDGLYLLMLGIAMYVLIGLELQYPADRSLGDFNTVYYHTRCLLQHCDPYQQSELLQFYRIELGGLDTIERRGIGTLSVFLPSTFVIVAPFAMLPWGLAHLAWTIFSAASLILAAIVTWDLGAKYTPILSGGMIGFLLANSAIVLGIGNTAGIVIGLCGIAVWCFLKERFVPAGILCLAICLAIKPHDAGLVWLYFILAGGVYRKRALQTLAVTVALGLAGVLWVSHIAPRWMPEMRSNLALISVHGGNNDPGPAGWTSKSRTTEVIVDLEAAVSVFRDDPRFYSTVSYLVCGTLLLVWSVTTMKTRYPPTQAWFALAAVSALSMLITYHRAYDAKLLLLTVPACAVLWAEGGPMGRVALLVNTLGLVFTGEIPLALLNVFTRNLHADTAGLFGKIEVVLLTRPAPLVLLAMSIFYLWVYVRRGRAGRPLPTPEKGSPAWGA